MNPPAARPHRDLRPGLVLDERYRLGDLLARGATGTVFAGIDQRTDAAVAVKVLHAMPSDEVRRRFLREARVCATLVDEHVVRFLDVGTFREQVPYLVMERLEGRDLRARLRESGALPLPVALDVAVQVCDGLAAVHARGIVHRDLKPSNLFEVAGAGSAITIKILDFGISKATEVDGAITETGALLGTPRFMAPEQVLGARHVDARADVWSLGAILYEMLTGRPPYDEKTLPRLLRAIDAGPPAPPSTLRPTLPKALDAVVLAALDREPETRTNDVAELAHGLLRAAGSASATAIRANLAAKLRRG